MEDKDEILEVKQNYLRQEIIEKGFSPDEFANFLSKTKGDDAADLNSYSLEDLRDIVRKFKEPKEPEKEKEKELEKAKVKVQEEDEDIIGEDEDLWGNKIEKKAKIPSLIIKCRKFEPSELINKREKLKVHITNVEIKKDGIFSLSYYEFTIKNDLINFEFKRRTDDFFWVKTKLASFYPNIFVPPIPKIKTKNDGEYIQKKIYYLQSFINYIIDNDLLLSSQLFQDFITLSYKEFKNSKEAFNLLSPPKRFGEMISSDGTLDIAVLSETDKKAYNIKSEIDKRIGIYNKLNSRLKEIIDLIYKLKEKYSNIANIFDELSHFDSKSEILKYDKANYDFIKLKGIFINCSNEYEKKMKYFEVHIRRFFKYIKNEINEFNCMYSNYDEIRKTYIDMTEKKNLVIDDDFIIYKKYFGFYLNVVFNEYINLNKVIGLKIKEHFSTASKYLNI